MASNIFSVIVLFFLLCGMLNLFFYMLAVYPAALLCFVFVLMAVAFYHDYVLIRK